MQEIKFLLSYTSYEINFQAPKSKLHKTFENMYKAKTSSTVPAMLQGVHFTNAMSLAYSGRSEERKRGTRAGENLSILVFITQYQSMRRHTHTHARTHTNGNKTFISPS